MPSPSRTPIEAAVRTSARVALWTALVVTAAIAFLLSRYSRPIPPAGYQGVTEDQALWEGVDFLAYPEVKLLQRYVQIDTSHPDPNEVAGAEFLAAQLAAAGIPATVERLGEKRANLWAFVEGDDPRALVLAGHIDVEPAANTAGWLYPPFSATVRGPWIYGRGMYDMKSLTIAQLLATVDAARAGHKPRRSLLFLQTSSEETGSDTGMRWIFDQHPELVARMGTALIEGGVIESTSPTDVKYWGIEFAQKRFARLTLCSSERRGLEAIGRAIRTGRQGDPLAEVHPAVRAFLASYSATRGVEPYRQMLTEPDLIPADPNRFNSLTPFMKSLFRDEVSARPVRRADDGSFEMDLWLQLLPDSDFDTVLARLLPSWRTDGVSVGSLERFGSSWPSPLEHPDYQQLVASVRAAAPEAPVGPYFLPWTMTDARHLRNRRIPTYGFAPFPVAVSDTLQIGLPNERMQLPAFRFGVDLYRQTVRRLID